MPKMTAKQRREMEQQKRREKFGGKPIQEPAEKPSKHSKTRGKGQSAPTNPPVKKEKLSLERETQVDKIRTDSFVLRVEVLSALHLGSGQADVNVDAEVIHDAYGLPYFPAKRLKGLLYESALEVVEMLSCCGEPFFSRKDVDELFQHGCTSRTQLVMTNLYLEGYEKIMEEWAYLQKAYGTFFQPGDVLGQYTSLRYQTRIDRETGTAADTSLHNMRVLEPGIEFCGEIHLRHGSLRHMKLLAMALRNLRYAGLKRNRGFGKIDCQMVQDNKDIRYVLVKEALKEGGVL